MARARVAWLERHLKTHAVVAVVGYPKSGKTTALSEYAQKSEACVWLTVPDPTTAAGDWLDLVAFEIGRFVSAATSDRSAVRHALLSFVATTKLLIVLDDAHFIPDLEKLQFLEQAAYASSGQLQIILLGTDRLPFVEAIRGSARFLWRLCGFTDKQATMMYEQMGGQHRPALRLPLRAGHSALS